MSKLRYFFKFNDFFKQDFNFSFFESFQLLFNSKFFFKSNNKVFSKNPSLQSNFLFNDFLFAPIVKDFLFNHVKFIFKNPVSPDCLCFVFGNNDLYFSKLMTFNLNLVDATYISELFLYFFIDLFINNYTFNNFFNKNFFFNYLEDFFVYLDNCEPLSFFYKLPKLFKRIFLMKVFGIQQNKNSDFLYELDTFFDKMFFSKDQLLSAIFDENFLSFLFSNRLNNHANFLFNQYSFDFLNLTKDDFLVFLKQYFFKELKNIIIQNFLTSEKNLNFFLKKNSYFKSSFLNQLSYRPIEKFFSKKSIENFLLTIKYSNDFCFFDSINLYSSSSFINDNFLKNSIFSSIFSKKLEKFFEKSLTNYTKINLYSSDSFFSTKRLEKKQLNFNNLKFFFSNLNHNNFNFFFKKNFFLHYSSYAVKPFFSKVMSKYFFFFNPFFVNAVSFDKILSFFSSFPHHNFYIIKDLNDNFLVYSFGLSNFFEGTGFNFKSFNDFSFGKIFFRKQISSDSTLFFHKFFDFRPNNNFFFGFFKD